jgi:hypothetical protein
MFLCIPVKGGEHVPVPLEIDLMPQILCGPMLRRVDSQSINVWIATKFARMVEVSLYEGNEVNPAKLIATGSAHTVALGTYLHAVVVTVKLTTAQALKGGMIYGYNVTLGLPAVRDPLDGYNLPSDLKAAGLLEHPLPLGYEENKLPTFAFVPEDISDIKIAHASCRLPHAGGWDMLPVLDDIIEISRNEPLQRPQLLFLTGDQIYADDVAAPLLHILTKTGDLLLGWPGNEELPVSDGTVKAADLKPGKRSKMAYADNKLFTSSEDENHLFSLGEFYSMYLHVWSDEVWPQQLPAFADVFPGETGKAHEKKYNQISEQIAFFKTTLRRVRRVLANVPTYMMFDDHEVTDDWNIHQEWVDRVYRNEFGKRVVINALSAFAVFQAWGNDPDHFDPLDAGGKEPNGRKLLKALENWKGRTTGNQGTYDELCKLLRIPPFQNMADGVRWDYEINYVNFQVIVLDTRTHRAFPGGKEDPPDLMSFATMGRQIDDRFRGVKHFTLVVSPAPVIGHRVVEKVAQKLPVSWILGRTMGREEDVAVDREAWYVEERPSAWVNLLKKLSRFKRVMFLSGDVHYAFSVEIKLWDESAVPSETASFVILTSSGLKNEAEKTRRLGLHSDEKATPTVEPGVSGMLIWDSPGKHVADEDGHKIKVSGTPAVLELPKGETELTPPKYRLSIHFAEDIRRSNNRWMKPALPPLSGAAGAFDDLSNRAWYNMEALALDQMRRVVGHNNLGLVKLAANPPYYGVIHELWYRMGTAAIFSTKSGTSEPLPYTRHFVSLTPPEPDDYKPVPYAVIPPIPDLSEWASLLSFVPPDDVQLKVSSYSTLGFRWKIHRIHEARGDINLDRYEVRISKLPATLPNGSGNVTPEKLFQYIRIHLNQFLDTTTAEVKPYSFDTALWNSSDPYMAICHWDMKMWDFNVDDGAVIVSDQSNLHWIFSTVWTGRDGGHPVSGNREFLLRDNEDGTWSFLTRGADRTTTMVDQVPGEALVFSQADQLWKSLQHKIADMIKLRGGQAVVETPHSERYDWTRVMQSYFAPTNEWL